MIFQITKEHIEQESLAYTKVGYWCYLSPESNVWHIRPTKDEVLLIKQLFGHS